MHPRNWIWIVSVVLLSVLVSGCAQRTVVERSEKAGPHKHRISEKRTKTITAVHRDNRAEIRSCFMDMAGDEEQAGAHRAEVELQLPASGRPASIRLLDAEELPEELRDCLEHVFADLEYGEGRRGATFYQVVEFDADNERISFERPVDAYRRWGLTGREIDGVIHAEEEAIEDCYDQADDSPSGRMVIGLGIDSEGMVSNASLNSSTLEEGQIEGCVIEILVELEFPEPRGGGVVVIDYPFTFNAEEGWTMEGAPGM